MQVSPAIEKQSVSVKTFTGWNSKNWRSNYLIYMEKFLSVPCSKYNLSGSSDTFGHMLLMMYEINRNKAQMLTDRAQSCMATRCLRHRVWSELSRTTLDVHFRGGVSHCLFASSLQNKCKTLFSNFIFLHKSENPLWKSFGYWKQVLRCVLVKVKGESGTFLKSKG